MIVFDIVPMSMLYMIEKSKSINNQLNEFNSEYATNAKDSRF